MSNELILKKNDTATSKLCSNTVKIQIQILVHQHFDILDLKMSAPNISYIYSQINKQKIKTDNGLPLIKINSKVKLFQNHNHINSTKQQQLTIQTLIYKERGLVF